MKLGEFRWLTDENINPQVVHFLRQMGLDVEDVCELGMQGESDLVILKHASAADRIVLTHDADFGTLVMHGGHSIVGIVYLRPGHIQPDFSIETLRTLLASETLVHPPFIVVARRTMNHVSIRVRELGGGSESPE